MSDDQNKTLIRRIFDEGLNQNKSSVFSELISPSLTIHDSPLGTLRGPEGYRQFVETFRKSFPDLKVAIEQELACDDYVIHRGYATGTHKGEFQGVSPTGKQIKVKFLDIWRVQNGKAVENWVQMDTLGLMQQLGAVPTPEYAGRY